MFRFTEYTASGRDLRPLPRGFTITARPFAATTIFVLTSDRHPDRPETLHATRHDAIEQAAREDLCDRRHDGHRPFRCHLVTR